MKKLFTILFILSIAFSAFAQEVLEILFLQDAVLAETDRFLFTKRVLEEEFGFNVEIGLIADAPTDGYDLAVIHEGINSSSAGLKRYNTAPMPLLVLKPYNVRSTGLGWANDPGTWDNNSPAIIIEMMHPILTGLPYYEDLDVGEEILIAGGDMEGGVAWVPTSIADAPGVSLIAVNANVDVPGQHSLLAIEEGTTLNGVQLENKAVIFTLNISVWETTTNEYDLKLTESGLKILENSCYWVAGKEIPGSETALSGYSSSQASVYPNPSTGMVKMKLDQTVSSLAVEVSGIDGRVLFTKEYHNTGFEELDLSGLQSGIYFIRLEGLDFSYTERLIINK